MARLSVILPVYNGSQYLQEAIDSVLSQTFSDFELLIINDGSTDASGNIIHSYNDSRIYYYEQTNRGLRETLNRGLHLSQGEYIARMDQDDISLPHRFRQQVEFLDQHPNHVLVGTTYGYIDTHGIPWGVFPALLHNREIQNELLTKSSFGHGSVMMRTSTIRRHNLQYNQTAVHVEDYDLWLRLSRLGEVANLPDVLYLWRESPVNTKSLHGPLQKKNAVKLQRQAISIVTPDFSYPRLHLYKNEAVEILGKTFIVERKNAYSSMYLNLAISYLQSRQQKRGWQLLYYALLVQPLYPLISIYRRILKPPRV